MNISSFIRQIKLNFPPILFVEFKVILWDGFRVLNFFSLRKVKTLKSSLHGRRKRRDRKAEKTIKGESKRKKDLGPSENPKN